jgi:hypothetical protein
LQILAAKPEPCTACCRCYAKESTAWPWATSDLNDHSTLRADPAIQAAVGQDQNPASSPTLCRFENWASPQSCWDISRVLVEIFIESFSAPPPELILDFDSTDDLAHGEQPGAAFHGYYKDS